MTLISRRAKGRIASKKQHKYLTYAIISIHPSSKRPSPIAMNSHHHQIIKQTRIGTE
jgi:hypothetical protein